jgi:ribose/xylose/arabinose/galactoside ABC-type transport system permease subunit
MFNAFTTLLALGVCFAVCCMVYAFLGIFIHENKKKRFIITVIIAMLGLAIYFYENNKHVVYMKEDVLYVKPIVDTSKTK